MRGRDAHASVTLRALTPRSQRPTRAIDFGTITVLPQPCETERTKQLKTYPRRFSQGSLRICLVYMYMLLVSFTYMYTSCVYSPGAPDPSQDVGIADSVRGPRQGHRRRHRQRQAQTQTQTLPHTRTHANRSTDRRTHPSARTSHIISMLNRPSGN